MTNREARALLFSPRPHAARAALLRDLLTEPGWGKWEGVADYEDGPATQIDARDTVVCVYVARPGQRARKLVLGLLAGLIVVLAWMLARGLGWM